MLPFETTRMDASKLKRPRTAIMLNLGNPELALSDRHAAERRCRAWREWSSSSASTSAIHPMALANPEKVTSAPARKAIERLVRNYARPADYFVEKLSEGRGT